MLRISDNRRTSELKVRAKHLGVPTPFIVEDIEYPESSSNFFKFLSENPWDTCYFGARTCEGLTQNRYPKG